MSLNVKCRMLAALTALALALPLAARGAAPKDSKSSARATVVLSQDATLAGKQVKAGTYEVKATESTVTLKQAGKVVAEASIEWKNEGTGSSSSGVLVESGSVKEFHFVGKARYAQVASESEPSTGQK